MKAVLYSKKSPSRFVLQEVHMPMPGDSEVLVKMAASSINAADYRSMKMGMIPKHKIFGGAITGTVESVGSKVHQFKSGDEVIGDLADFGFGGYAEFAVAPENTLVIKPSCLSFEDASTLPVAATTALKALRDKGNIKSGHKVLIVGASGGVGSFAVQLAKHFGAEVTGVCSTQSVDQTLGLGADHVIDYTKDNFLNTEERFDLILAVNGSYPILGYKRLLASTGTYVAVGGSLSQIFKSMIFGWPLSLGSKTMTFLSAKGDPKDLAFVANLMAEGAIKPNIEKRYTLDQTPQAMEYLAEGHAKGKVVIHLN